MSSNNIFTSFMNLVFVLATVGLITQLAACASGSHAAKGAGQGATTGAVSGAVGGLVSGLVFGGDPLDRAARGAVYGGAVGATAGAMAGSQVDKKVKAQQEASLTKLRNDIGEDAFNGLAALAECKHDITLQHANKAQQSQNPNYALAGLWLELLSYADQGEEAKARTLFPTVVAKDWDIKTEAQAEEGMRKALSELMSIREEYQLPRVCGS